jgi:hypothetical protein
MIDQEFPFYLPVELELLVLAYAAERDEVLKAFRVACEQGELHLAQRLASVFELTATNDLNDITNSFSWACWADRFETVQWLVEYFGLKTAGARARSNWLLQQTCKNGNLPFARWLSTKLALTPADVRASGNCALQSACGGGHLAAAQWLAGAFGLTAEDARSGDNMALRLASENGHLGVVRWLVARFGLTSEDARSGNRYALRWAYAHGHLQTARWLAGRFGLTAEDARANNGEALLRACHERHFTVAYWLVARHLDRLSADTHADIAHALRSVGGAYARFLVTALPPATGLDTIRAQISWLRTTPYGRAERCQPARAAKLGQATPNSRSTVGPTSRRSGFPIRHTSAEYQRDRFGELVDPSKRATVSRQFRSVPQNGWPGFLVAELRGSVDETGAAGGPCAALPVSPAKAIKTEQFRWMHSLLPKGITLGNLIAIIGILVLAYNYAL